jgi:hypothetical protein
VWQRHHPPHPSTTRSRCAVHCRRAIKYGAISSML